MTRTSKRGRMAYRLPIVLLALLALTAGALPPGDWPLDGPIAGEYDPPPQDWQPGHRGIDIAGSPGAPVRAAADGQVSYVGQIAGVGVMTISHGDVRTTYQPVRAGVRVGQKVALGEPVGVLLPGYRCDGRGAPRGKNGPAAAAGSTQTCLHWGLKRGETYLDPRELLRAEPATGTVRMLPAADRARVEAAAKDREAVSDQPGTPSPPGEHGFIRPVNGPTTSPFGMRVHPITGVYKLHDGVDWGAACGTPIRAAYGGTVTTAALLPAWGNRVVIEHGVVDGRAVRTSYNHMAEYLVRPGQRVAAGQLVGLVGSTGYSTGCHLHLQLWLDGGIVDPMTWLS